VSAPFPPDQLEELAQLGEVSIVDAPSPMVLIHDHKLVGIPSEVDLLLCPWPREGYPTRLFLSARIATKGPNWRPETPVFLGRPWYGVSFNHVHANQRLAQMLSAHLGAFV